MGYEVRSLATADNQLGPERMHFIVDRVGTHNPPTLALTITYSDEEGRDASCYLSPPRLRLLEQQLRAAHLATDTE